MKYQPCGEDIDAGATRQELESFLQQVMPGWRATAEVVRFLPRMTVASALDLASTGGCMGRPSSAVPGLGWLSMCGDWVGSRGLLADASLGSAQDLGRRLLAGARTRAAA